MVIDLVRSNPVVPTISPARLAAVEILLRVEEGAYASVLLATRESELSPLDRSLCHELVMGVLRQQLWLDKVIEHYAKRKAGQLDPAIRLILRLGVYQLRFLSRIPASAAVNESVNLVKFARLRSASGLVNAVLRRAAREPEFDPTAKISNPIEKLAVATSHPVWLIKRWNQEFGPEETEAFARSNNEPSPVAFRVVQNRSQAEDIIELLRQSGAELTPSRITGESWRISGNSSLLATLVAQGKVYVQDEASQLVARVLNAQPSDRVLDLCAAPGSKASQIADLTNDSTSIVAGDLYEHRLRTVVQTSESQGFHNIQCVVLDGLRTLPLADRVFDRVLVDAPCSGTGTLRHNPEIRWRISPADIQDLSRRQKQLLSNAAGSVKPGGRLVYSTCSVETDENEHVRQWFLDNSNDFEAAGLDLDSALLSKEGTARTWPHRHDTDGFFICAFARKSE
jgi:16S rRNA (cytosine967-C5)-methyltransferase